MLYDILPPILLLFSFAGIIVVISRAMVRVRALEVSQEIQANVMSKDPVHAESVIGPNKGNVHIVGNRLVHVLQLAWAGIRSVGPAVQSRMLAMKESRANRRVAKLEKKAAVAVAAPVAEPVQVQKPEGITPPAPKAKLMAGIQLPEVSIREKMEEFANMGKEKFSQVHAGIKKHAPDIATSMNSMRDKVMASMPVRKTQEQVPKATPIIRLVHQDSVADQKKGIVAQMMQRSREESPLDKAERVIQENNFDEAEDILIPYIMKHASDTKAYMLLGKAAVGKGSWDDALEIFQQVLKMNNEEVEVHAQLGHAALQAGKFTIAMQSLQRARDNDPDNVSIREDLLFIARRMDNKVLEKGVLEELAVLKEKARA